MRKQFLVVRPYRQDILHDMELVVIMDLKMIGARARCVAQCRLWDGRGVWLSVDYGMGEVCGSV